MPRPSTTFLPAALAACLAMSACSGSSSPAADSSSKASAPGQAAASQSADPALPTVDVAQAGAAAITFNAPEQKVTAQALRFAKARNLSTAVEVLRNRMLQNAWHAGATQEAVTSQVVASSDAVVGVALTSKQTVAGTTTTTPATVWYSTAAKQSYSSPALVKASQWGALGTALTKAGGSVDATKLATALKAKSAPYGDGPALGFNAKGDLVAQFPSGTLGADVTTLVVPAADATPLLSVLGAQAQKAATSPSAFTGTTTQPADPELAWSKAKASQTSASATATPSVDPSAGAEAFPTSTTTASGASSATPSAAAVARPSTAVGPDCRVLHCVAITYDDGPGAETPKLLETIKKNKVSITFFQMGNSIKEFPKTAQQVAAAGMEIGNHTLTHPDLQRKTEERMTHEIQGNSELIKGFMGATPLLFRPPYGSHNAAVDKVALDNGMAIMQWEVDTNDWQTHSAERTLSAALGAVNYHATIVLEHDIQQASIDAAPQLYPALKAKGMTVVSVSELSVNSGGYQAGHAYCRGTQLAQEGFNCKG